MRTIIACVLALTGPVACAESTPSALVGAMSLHFDDAAAPSVDLEEAPSKFRAQINDDGATCRLWAVVIGPEGDEVLNVTTYPDQVSDLIAGRQQTIEASSNQDRAIAVNAATLYLRLDGTWFSRSGAVTVAPLPAPLEKLQIDVTDVEFSSTDGRAPRVGNGVVDLTYIGAVATHPEGARACPQLALYPGGVPL